MRGSWRRDRLGSSGSSIESYVVKYKMVCYVIMLSFSLYAVLLQQEKIRICRHHAMLSHAINIKRVCFTRAAAAYARAMFCFGWWVRAKANRCQGGGESGMHKVRCHAVLFSHVAPLFIHPRHKCKQIKGVIVPSTAKMSKVREETSCLFTMKMNGRRTGGRKKAGSRAF